MIYIEKHRHMDSVEIYVMNTILSPLESKMISLPTASLSLLSKVTYRFLFVEYHVNMAYIGKYYGNAKKQNHSIFSSVNSGTVYVYGQVDSAFDLIRVTSFA